MPMPNIPETMRAAVVERFGGPEVLTLRSVPVPEIGAGEVLIAVHAAGVAGWDADMREGWSPSGRKRLPLILGTDGSGTVAAVGSRVRRLKIGQKVMGFVWDSPKGGFYAEYVAVAADNVAPLPRTIGFLEAGVLPASGFTALEGIDVALRLKRGQSVVIHGASGAVGTLAVQFAKLSGARIFAGASGEDGVALVRRLGADDAADGRKSDLAAALRAFAPQGADAVLALIGGKALTPCIRALRRGGVLAYPNGVEPAPRKRAGIKVVAYDGNSGLRNFERLTRAVESAKKFDVPIAAEFPLEQAAEAHRRLAGHLLGKIVLRVR